MKKTSRKTVKRSVKPKLEKSEQPKTSQAKCHRCKYPLADEIKSNICTTCTFELFMLSVHKLNEHI